MTSEQIESLHPQIGIPNTLLQQINFIKEIDKLKYIQRKTKLFNSDRHENDAEHSWHLAMMTIVLAEHSDKPIDVLKNESVNKGILKKG